MRLHQKAIEQAYMCSILKLLPKRESFKLQLIRLKIGGIAIIKALYTGRNKNKGTLVFLQEFCAGAIAADSQSSDTPYHLQYARQVLCMCCLMWRSHLILTWTLYLLCVLDKINNEIQGFPYFWFCVYDKNFKGNMRFYSHFFSRVKLNVYEFSSSTFVICLAYITLDIP